MASRGIPGLSGALQTAISDLQAADPDGHWNFDRIAVEVTSLGTPLSSAYVRQLAGGRDVAVSAMVMVNLAKVLHKPLMYFLDADVRQAMSADENNANTIATIIGEFRSLPAAQQEAVLRRLSSDSR